MNLKRLHAVDRPSIYFILCKYYKNTQALHILYYYWILTKAPSVLCNGKQYKSAPKKLMNERAMNHFRSTREFHSSLTVSDSAVFYEM